MIEAGGQNTLISNVMKFGKVFREFDNRIKDIKNYPLKWTFISGHDFDLMAMHMAMKTSSPQCIEEIARTGSTSAIECEKGSNDFVGSLIIELHLDD